MTNDVGRVGDVAERAREWQPRIGEEVRVAEHVLREYGDWRDVRLWVSGLHMGRAGINVTVIEMWPPDHPGGTDGFYIAKNHSPDDLVPVSLALRDHITKDSSHDQL